MRSSVEQLRGLDAVAREVASAGCNCAIAFEGDLPFLQALGPQTGSHQIMFVIDGYDVWSVDWNGVNFYKANVSVYEAAQIIINDYTKWKKNTTGRLPMKNPNQREN
jgi:hypothetical protein